MTTALVTGVAGQDGSYLAEMLVARGWQVHGLVRDPAERQSAAGILPGAVQVHSGDLTDVDAMSGLLRATRPHHVFNLAAVSSVAYSWDHAEEVARVNGLAAVLLMDATLRLQDDLGREVRFVQASSCEIFGEPEEPMQSERTPVRPLNPYAAAKAFAHLSCAVYRARGLHCSGLILYNHESPRRPPTFVVRKITQAAAAVAKGHPQQLVLGNLESRRDWGWAPDVVDALARACLYPTPDDYVVATGTLRSVGDVVQAAFASVGVDDWRGHVQTDPALYRPNDATALVGDATKARTILGWAPTVGFDEMIARMIAAEGVSGPTG